MTTSNRLTALAVLCLGMVFGMTASARTLELIEGAHEVALAEVTLPGSPVGTVFFRACGTCDPQGMTVMPQTVYEIGGRSFRHREFLEAVDELHDNGGNATAMVTIFYDLESNRVTRIAVFPQQEEDDADRR